MTSWLAQGYLGHGLFGFYISKHLARLASFLGWVCILSDPTTHAWCAEKQLLFVSFLFFSCDHR